MFDLPDHEDFLEQSLNEGFHPPAKSVTQHSISDFATARDKMPRNQNYYEGDSLDDYKMFERNSSGRTKHE